MPVSFSRPLGRQALARAATLLLLVPAPALAQDIVIPASADSTGTVRYTPGLQQLDAKNGFRDAKFGTPFAAFKGLVRAAPPEQGTSFYRRPTDARLIGPYQLTSITYAFRRGKLAGVLLQVRGSDNCDGVFETMRKLYGPSRDEQQHLYNAHTANQTWVGQRVRLQYDQDIDTDVANFIFFSIPSLQTDASERAKAEKRAVNDL